MAPPNPHLHPGNCSPVPRRPPPVRTLRSPGRWPLHYRTRRFPCAWIPAPPSPRAPAPVRTKRESRGRAACGVWGKGGVGTPICTSAPRPGPCAAARSLQEEGRARPASSRASRLRGGDTRQKAAGRRRGRARPGTPTRTPPAVGAERRATTSARAWPRRPALLPPRLSGPRCLPAPPAARKALTPAAAPSPRASPPRAHIRRLGGSTAHPASPPRGPLPPRAHEEVSRRSRGQCRASAGIDVRGSDGTR